LWKKRHSYYGKWFQIDGTERWIYGEMGIHDIVLNGVSLKLIWSWVLD